MEVEEMEVKERKYIKLPIPAIDLSFLNKINISHILLISLVLRVFVMSFPSDGGKIFDEAHYTGAVNKILEGIHANPEHPPLTKLIVAGFITIFGNYWFSWRLPMVICSMMSTYLVYLIAREFFDEKLALLASSFLIFDMIWFIHGNIFMLEPPCMMFGLGFVLLYLRGRYKWSGVAFSLACLSNEKALFFLVGVGLYSAMTEMLSEFSWSKWKLDFKINWKFFKDWGTIFLIFCVVGIGGLGIVDFVMKPSRSTSINIGIQHTIIKDVNGSTIRTDTATTTHTNQVYINNPIEHGLWMFSYYSGINANLRTTPGNFRPPWNWITPFVVWGGSIGEHNCEDVVCTHEQYHEDVPIVQVFNPSRYLVTVVRAGDKVDYIINYRAQVPIFIWYMTIPIMILSIYHWREKEAKFMLAWVTGSYVPWLVKDIIQQNMCFVHYFQFTIPIVCIGIPWFWNKTVPKYWKQITAVHLLCTIVFFFWFFPVGVVRTIV